jgi:trk system potassium uptake protein TrkH
VTERGNIFGKDYYLRILFETTSAFGTVGLSTGITSMLTSAGKILIILTMFAGRIGPLTLALTLALQEDKLLYNYPEEEVMVG